MALEGCLQILQFIRENTLKDLSQVRLFSTPVDLCYVAITFLELSSVSIHVLELFYLDYLQGRR